MINMGESLLSKIETECGFDTPMLEPAFTAWQPLRDLTEGLGLRRLTKVPRDKRIPARKALRWRLGFQIVHLPGEIMAIEQGDPTGLKSYFGPV